MPQHTLAARSMPLSRPYSKAGAESVTRAGGVHDFHLGGWLQSAAVAVDGEDLIPPSVVITMPC